MGKFVEFTPKDVGHQLADFDVLDCPRCAACEGACPSGVPVCSLPSIPRRKLKGGKEMTVSVGMAVTVTKVKPGHGGDGVEEKYGPILGRAGEVAWVQPGLGIGVALDGPGGIELWFNDERDFRHHCEEAGGA